MRPVRAAALVAAGALAASVAAARPAPSPDLVATAGPGAIALTGSVAVEDAAVHAIFDSSGDADVPGTDIVGGAVVQPDPFDPTLDFTLEIGDPIPEHSILPDGVQIEWTLDIAGGEVSLTAVGHDAANASPEHLFSIQTCSPPDPQTNVAECSSSAAEGSIDGGLLTWHIPYASLNALPGTEIVSTGAAARFSAFIGAGRVSGGVVYDEAAGFEVYEVAAPGLAYTVLDDDGNAVDAGATTLASPEVDLDIDGLAPAVYDLVVDVCYGTCSTASFTGLDTSG